MDNLPATIFIAFGVIAAALITGFWSFVSLVVSKDQKVSEFRQIWIDELRKDISEYIGYLIAFDTGWLTTKDAHSDKNKAGTEFLKSNLANIQKIVSLSHRIVLRLNPDEHDEIIVLLQDIERIIASPTALEDEDLLDNTISKLSKESQKLLKGEWERVKKGEAGFRYTKNSSLGTVTVSAIIAIVYLYNTYA